MEQQVPEGTVRSIEGRMRVYYDGYWIRAYAVPADSLFEKKKLIEALTRRLFNHVEHGINIPGTRLDEARHAFDTEQDVHKKRVKAAMLAGAIFNRAADIFTKLVELQALGVVIEPSNPLMRECGQLLQEALGLGKLVKHRSGEEGIDELWGEPFKAFAFPVEDFYRSRYLKIAQTMHAIDLITDELTRTFQLYAAFIGIDGLLADLSRAAKAKCETLRTDEDVFDVWSEFAVASEALSDFEPRVSADATALERRAIVEAVELLRRGRDVVAYITRARVPMPKTTRDLVSALCAYRETYPSSVPSRYQASATKTTSL